MAKIKNKHKLAIILITGGLVLLTLLIALIKRTNLYDIIDFPSQIYLKSSLFLIQSIYSIFGDTFQFTANYVFIDGLSPLAINSSLIMKKWLIVVLILIWISPVAKQVKLKTSIIYFIYHFIVICIKVSNIILLYNSGTTHENSLYLGQSISYLLLFIFLQIWIKKVPEIINSISRVTKTNPVYLKKKIKTFVYLVYGLIFIQILLGIFQFLPWINLIFNTTHQILAWFGYESTVEPFYLLGKNGNIYMAKGCLGIKTTYLYVAFIILTGEGINRKLLVSLIGVIIINIVNILRFVFLFIHLQNHGKYLWNIEVHDLFNVLVYSLIFILWIIWLEWFTDIWPYLKADKSKKLNN